MLNVSTFGNMANIYAIVHSFHTRVSISRSTRATAPVIRLRKSGHWRGVEAQRQCPSQTPRRKSRTELNPVTGVATALTRHPLLLCVLSTFVAIFDWNTLASLCTEPENRLGERRNHYCLHSTVASASFLTCFTDLWITLYIVLITNGCCPSYSLQRGFGSSSSWPPVINSVVCYDDWWIM